MKFDITCDANLESGLNELLNELYDSGFNDRFSEELYDDSGTDLFVVLMCRLPELKFKQRIRLAKKENCLYMDLMLDLTRMNQADLQTRKRIVASKLITEVPEIIAKYKHLDFDLIRFKSHLSSWFEDRGWLVNPG